MLLDAECVSGGLLRRTTFFKWAQQANAQPWQAGSDTSAYGISTNKRAIPAPAAGTGTFETLRRHHLPAAVLTRFSCIP